MELSEPTPQELAVQFLANYISLPTEEISELDITVGLTFLITQVIIETAKTGNQARVLH